VISIRKRRTLRGLLNAHARDLFVRESIRFEIGKTPVSIAVVGPDGCGASVGADRLFAAPNRLQCMGDGEVNLIGFGRFSQELAIKRNRLVVFAQAHAGRRIGGAIGAIIGVDLQQFVELLHRPDVLVALHEHISVVVPCRVIVGRELQECFKKYLGIIEDIELGADLGEESHALNVVAVRQQELTDQALRFRNIAICKHGRRRYDFHRQIGERCDVKIGHFFVGRLSGHMEERLESLPACRQGRIQIHRP